MMVTRREVLRFLGAGTGLALLAACQPAQPAAPAKPTAAAAAPAATTAPAAGATVAAAPPAAAKPAAGAPAATTAVQPKSGGALRSAILADVANLDPHINTGSGRDTFFPAFDRITYYDDKLK